MYYVDGESLGCYCGSFDSTCFVEWTQVIMADWSRKNIEDVKIWDKLLWQFGSNTVLWYDRPVLWNRHLWSINWSEYFVSDEHPFMTIEWWKSFNPEMTKLEIDLDTTQLNVWDVLIKENSLEVVNSVDYIESEYNTPLYNFSLDWDHTYFANWYLVHNKQDLYKSCTPAEGLAGDQVCFVPTSRPTYAQAWCKSDARYIVDANDWGQCACCNK